MIGDYFKSYFELQLKHHLILHKMEDLALQILHIQIYPLEMRADDVEACPPHYPVRPLHVQQADVVMLRPDCDCQQIHLHH